jgi:hypothetical protein
VIVTAALIWFNEKAADLKACVEGMATVADRLVAVDGAYARYPGATVRSPKAQEQAIRRAADNVGIDVEIVIPDELWPGQVAKRGFALARATEGSDWIVHADADWRITGDRDAIRAELEEASPSVDVLSVPFYTPAGDAKPSAWHEHIGDTLVDLPFLFRAHPGFTVERVHWAYSALKGRQRWWIWGGDRSRPRAVHHKLKAECRIEHLTLKRSPKQVLASRAFLNDRVKVMELTNQEDDVDGLPEPEWDYETIPYTRDYLQSRYNRKMTSRERYLLRRRGISHMSRGQTL